MPPLKTSNIFTPKIKECFRLKRKSISRMTLHVFLEAIKLLRAQTQKRPENEATF